MTSGERDRRGPGWKGCTRALDADLEGIWNELRGEPQVSWWGRVRRNRMGDRSLARSLNERETEEVKEGNQARRRREGHAL